jgi:hypothetical protein
VASNPGSIPAGGKDKISVVVHTGGKGGQSLRKIFTVFTNDPKQSRIKLTVNGKVTAYAKIDPPYVRLTGRQGDLLSATVRVTPQEGFPFTVTDVKTNGNRNIQVTLEPMGKNPVKEGYQILVTGIRTEVGAFRDTILVHTDLKEKSILRIPVSGRIQPRASDGTKSPNTK